MRNLRKEGLHGGALIEDLAIKATEDREAETNASSSPELRTDIATEDLSKSDRAQWQISPELRERYSKIRARFDALPNPRVGAAA
jgi:hypothetical protein